MEEWEVFTATAAEWARRTTAERERAGRAEALARRLRARMESTAAAIEYQAARAVEQNYHPTTAHRYAAALRGLAYEAREALRAALADEEPPE